MKSKLFVLMFVMGHALLAFLALKISDVAEFLHGLKFCCRFNIFLFVKIKYWKTFFPHKISDCEVDLCVVQHIFFVLISCMNQKLKIMDATES